MKIDYDWLKQYVDVRLPPHEFGHLLTMSGLEIEAEESVKLPDGKMAEVLELNVTPNRGYCLSHIGVAREAASLLNLECRLPTPLKELEAAWEENSDSPVDSVLEVVNEAPDLCSRYAGMVVEGVQPGPSPKWLADRLIAIGLRPINNIVDVTNYVMMEYGQPLHAFDRALLTNSKIVIRRANEGEAFAALDGSEHKLGTDALVIADAEKPVALAGIMGGSGSQVTDQTQSVVLESACFDPATVRKASKKYNLRSDSSFRFERGVDMEGVILAQARAALLIRELAGGRILKGRIDLYPNPRKPIIVKVRVARVNKVLGAGLESSKIAEYLRRLGMLLKGSESPEAEEFQVEIPSFRPDLLREIDLIEEIARMTGYNNFETVRPSAPIQPVRLKPQQIAAKTIRETLSRIGYLETINYSFIDDASALEFKTAFGDDHSAVVPLRNPLSADINVMRPSLLPGLIKTAVRNFNKGQKPVKIFELGHVYFREGETAPVTEKNCLGILVAGPYENNLWKSTGKAYDYFDLKGALETVLDGFKLSAEYEAVDREFLRTGEAAACRVNGRVVGFLGKLESESCSDIGQPVYVCEINLDALTELLPGRVGFRPISRFPETYRDISILVDREAPSSEIEKAIREACAPLISKVELYDHFEGKKLQAGKKSLTFALAFLSEEKTLADEEVNPLFERALESLREKFGASLREG